jgi:uncharacterized protein YdeI (YjbR/CyaY-like superfamily)
MSTLEEVKAAEQRMNDAKKALQRYTERSTNERTDRKLHLRLAQELKQATDDYLASVIALK